MLSQVNLCPLTTTENHQAPQKYYLFTFIFLSVLCAFHLFHNGLNGVDQPVHWKIYAYTVRGIDIYSLRGASDFIPEIGEIPAGFHASPWGCLLQTVFYGGFLPFEAAKIYYLVVCALVLVAVSLLLCRKAGGLSSWLGIWALILSLLSSDFMASVYVRNAGGMIAAFLVAAWLVCDEHEYISGVLLGFAMVKPQAAAIVCLAFLMAGKLKPIIVAALVDVSAWLAVSVLTHKGMFELLRSFLFASDRAEGSVFAGIFTLVFESRITAMVASMILGMIFACLLQFALPRKTPNLFRIYPACMAATFWCYSTNNDCYVLVIPAILCIYLAATGRKIFWLLCSVYCSYGIIIRSVLRRAMSLPGGQLIIPTTIYEIGIIIIGVMTCVELRRICGNAQP